MCSTVLELTYNWPAETFIQRHVRVLKDANFPVQMIARHRLTLPGNNASLGPDNTEIHADVMPNFNHLHWAGKLFSLRHLTVNSLFNSSISSVSQKTLLGYFERLSPDLIHFHSATLASSMAWIPRALGVPYTLSLRGSDVQIFPLQSLTQQQAVVSAIQGAAKVHSVCRAIGQNAAKMTGNSLDFTVIYTTLPILPGLPSWSGIESSGEFNFVSSGRLVWHKGFGNLLAALRWLRDMGLDAKLTIIGIGPEWDHLLYLRRQLNLDAVVDLPGKLTYEQTLDVFHRASAYIQSSIAEGLSNSLAEAMANGLPVFATDVGGTREAIEDGVTGFLLPPFAPHEWAKMFLVVRDVPLMERVRTTAYQKAVQLFSAERHAREFVTFYRDALK